MIGQINHSTRLRENIWIINVFENRCWFIFLYAKHSYWIFSSKKSETFSSRKYGFFSAYVGFSLVKSRFSCSELFRIIQFCLLNVRKIFNEDEHLYNRILDFVGKKIHLKWKTGQNSRKQISILKPLDLFSFIKGRKKYVLGIKYNHLWNCDVCC